MRMVESTWKGFHAPENCLSVLYNPETSIDRLWLLCNQTVFNTESDRESSAWSVRDIGISIHDETGMCSLRYLSHFS